MCMLSRANLIDVSSRVVQHDSQVRDYKSVSLPQAEGTLHIGMTLRVYEAVVQVLKAGLPGGARSTKLRTLGQI
jgi:hypothetical protein